MHKKFYKSVLKAASQFFSVIFEFFQLSFGKMIFFFFLIASL